MRLRSFYGQNMTEVMRAVREALGENAIIVATRDDEMGGVRVTAAIEEQALRIETRTIAAENRSIPTDNDGSESIELIAKALLQHQVPNAIAERLLATATQYASEDPLLALGAALDTHFTFDTIGNDTSKPIMLVGPPGAGKTLCTAKFATQATLSKKKCAIISTDTQRAGGMAQLSAFAHLLGQDILEIEDSHALQDAVSIQNQETLTLIDTAGCNPFVEEEKLHLLHLIKSSGAMSVLVLPADMDASMAIDLSNEFSALGAKHLLSTRLDMARRVGGLLSTAFETRLTLCYFTSTTKVTEAPSPLNPVSLARLILPKTQTTKNKSNVRSA